MLSKRRDSVDPVPRLRNQFHVALLLQRECDAIANKRMIVNAEHPDFA